MPWGGAFEQKLSAQFKCPAYARPRPPMASCLTLICALRRLIRRSAFTKLGSYFIFFRQNLFKLKYALHCQNYFYTLLIKANLSRDKHGHRVTYCNISTRCSTQCKRVTRIPAEFEFFFITRNILKPETKIQKVYVSLQLVVRVKSNNHIPEFYFRTLLFHLYLPVSSD